MEKLILITPYAALSDLAKNRFWFLPTKTLLRENYDSLKNLENYQGQVLFIISELDQLIPAKFGKKLLNGFEGLKQEIFVLGADHYTWWEKMTEKQKQIFTYFQQELLAGRIRLKLKEEKKQFLINKGIIEEIKCKTLKNR